MRTYTSRAAVLVGLFVAALGVMLATSTVASAAPKDTPPSSATCKPGKTNGSKVCPTPPPGPVEYTTTATVGPFAPGEQFNVTLNCNPGDTYLGTTWNTVDVNTGQVVGTDAGGYPLYLVNAFLDTDSTGAFSVNRITFRNNGQSTIRLEFTSMCRKPAA